MEPAATEDVQNLEESTAVTPTDEKTLKIMMQIRMILALKYAKTDNMPSEILENLYIGSVGAAMNKKNLKDLGITHILIVADQLSPAFPNDFAYKQISVLDSPAVNMLAVFQESFDFIDCARSEGKVLVHW